MTHDEWTAIFGKVTILEEFGSEEEARRAGYNYDAHVYRINDFGGIEPTEYKVLARSTDFTHMEYAKVRRDKDGKV